MDRRTKMAVCFTVVYLVGITALIAFKSTEFFSLPLNGLGDFLAGAFGPLALAWLVFGYFQQGDELRQGTEALKLQSEELRRSAEQQHRLAEISLQSLELERDLRLSQERQYRESLRPILTLDGNYPQLLGERFVLECQAQNNGAQIYGVEIHLSFNGEIKTFHKEHTMAKGSTISFNCTWDPKVAADKLVVIITYKDQGGYLGVANFYSVPSNDFGSIDFVIDSEISD